MARANLLLADHLGIAHARAVIGSSIGGFQALEMALERPGFARKLILIATAARAQPWTIAADEAQRMALEADTTFGTDSPDAGRRGMEAARAIGLLTYRGSSAYNATQQEHDDPDKTRGFRACSYQRHQGEKLSRRFDAYPTGASPRHSTRTTSGAAAAAWSARWALSGPTRWWWGSLRTSSCPWANS